MKKITENKFLEKTGTKSLIDFLYIYHVEFLNKESLINKFQETFERDFKDNDIKSIHLENGETGSYHYLNMKELSDEDMKFMENYPLHELNYTSHGEDYLSELNNPYFILLENKNNDVLLYYTKLYRTAHDSNVNAEDIYNDNIYSLVERYINNNSVSENIRNKISKIDTIKLEEIDNHQEIFCIL